MKIIKFICLLILAITYSCSADNNGNNDYILWGDEPWFYGYTLYLRFQDASSNDLIKGIEYDGDKIRYGFATVNPDLYALKFVFPDGILTPWKPEPQPGVILAEHAPTLFLETEKDDYYFILRSSSVNWRDFGEERVYFPFSEKLTFELTCPYVFGDDAVHEIITYWKEGNVSTCSCLCYCIELEGKEYTQITHAQYDQSSVATIILDR